MFSWNKLCHRAGLFFFLPEQHFLLVFETPSAARGRMWPSPKRKAKLGRAGCDGLERQPSIACGGSGGKHGPPCPRLRPPRLLRCADTRPRRRAVLGAARPRRGPAPSPRPSTKPRPSRPQAPPQGGPRHRLRLAGSRLRHPSTAPPQLTSFDWAAPTASQRRARRLLGVVDGSGAPPASCGLWRPLIGGGGSGPLPSRLGRGRCLAARGSAPPSPWAPATTSTTTSSKVPPPAAGRAAPHRGGRAPLRAPRRRWARPGPARQAAGPGGGRRGLCCAGRPCGQRPAAPGRGWARRRAAKGGAPRGPSPPGRGGGCAPAAGRSRFPRWPRWERGPGRRGEVEGLGRGLEGRWAAGGGGGGAEIAPGVEPELKKNFGFGGELLRRLLSEP